MDYTTIPRHYIYRDRKDLDEFDISNSITLDWKMFELIQESEIILFDGANKYALEIFNTAYYLITLILLEPHPMLFVTRYLIIADRVGSVYSNEQNTYHRYFKAMTMALVYNYLTVLKPRNLVKDNRLLKSFWNHFVNTYKEKDWDGKARFLFFNNVLPDMEVHTFAVYPEHFNPRPIIDVLKGSSYFDIDKNIPYIVERIKLLPPDKRTEALRVAKKSIKETVTLDMFGHPTHDVNYIIQKMNDSLSITSNSSSTERVADLYSDETPALSPQPDSTLLAKMAELQATIKDQQSRIAELEALIREKNAALETLEMELEYLRTPCEDIPANGVTRLGLLLLLFLKSGAQLSTYGNKNTLASLMKMVTNLPEPTCKNFCTNKTLGKVKKNEEAVEGINKKLKELGLKMELQVGIDLSKL